MLPLRLIAALIPTTAVLVAPAAAHAERVVIEDAVADAQSISSDFVEEVFTPAPDHMAGDITRTVVAHGVRRVEVQVRHRELDGTLPRGAYLKVRTPDRRFDIETSRNTPETGTRLTRGRRGDDVRCPGLRSSVDDANDQLTVSVPTACLGAPAWVQVGVLSVVADVDIDSPVDQPYLMYVDDANKAGGFEDHGVRVGPKVFAG